MARPSYLLPRRTAQPEGRANFRRRCSSSLAHTPETGSHANCGGTMFFCGGANLAQVKSADARRETGSRRSRSGPRPGIVRAPGQDTFMDDRSSGSCHLKSSFSKFLLFPGYEVDLGFSSVRTCTVLGAFLGRSKPKFSIFNHFRCFFGFQKAQLIFKTYVDVFILFECLYKNVCFIFSTRRTFFL